MRPNVSDTASLALPSPPEIQETVKSSVARSSWRGLFVEEVRFAPGRRVIPAQSHHLVTVNLDSGLHLCQRRNGAVSQERHTYGDITLTPAGSVDHRVWDSPCHALHFWMEDTCLAKIAQETMPNQAPISASLLQNQFLARDSFLEHLATEFREVLAQARASGETNAGSSLYAESLRNVFVVHLLRRFGPPVNVPAAQGLLPEVLQRLQHFVCAHLETDLSLPRLAEVAGLSQFHLARLFKESTGTTLHQFVLNTRVEQAKQLLASETGTTAEVAYRVGFGSQSLLTRHFKQIVGVTPAAFARARRHK